MSKKLNRTDLYIDKANDFAKPILTHLRELVHLACPETEETFRWNFPHFDYKGPLCHMAAFKKHCAFGFWKAPLMKDPHQIFTKMKKNEMSSFGKITALEDLPDDRIIIEYIKEAVLLNDKGIKLPVKKSTTNKQPEVPDDFKQLLAKNAQATEVFNSFSHSNQKEYIEWITEAKREATRNKRMQTALEWIAEGKPKNWKYIKK